MTSQKTPATGKTPQKKKKLDIQPASALLLTPGSSRRKNAWGRLRNSGDNRGMTQAQVADYLESQMKKMYGKVRKEGALTSDKVDNYLAYLARTASQTLIQARMDRKTVTRFSQETEPVLIDIGSKQTLSDADFNRHTREITEKAKNRVEALNSPQSPDPDIIDIEIIKPDEPAPSKPSVDLIKEASQTGEIEFLKREIVPIGFEEGAPKIGIKDFLELPISARDEGPEESNWFAAHQKYLEMAVAASRFKKEDLSQIRQLLETVPRVKYGMYFNIFPDLEYEDAQMMIVYSRWRNGTLKSLRINMKPEES